MKAARRGMPGRPPRYRLSRRGHWRGSVAAHDAFAARIGAAEPALRRALQALQAGVHLHLAHLVAARLQLAYHLGADLARLHLGRAIAAAEIRQADGCCTLSFQSRVPTSTLAT